MKPYVLSWRENQKKGWHSTEKAGGGDRQATLWKKKK